MNMFPALVPDDTNHITIKGEVYCVDDLTPLDFLEGYPDHYNRKQIDTVYGPAWVYYYNTPRIDAKVVDNGFW